MGWGFSTLKIWNNCEISSSPTCSFDSPSFAQVSLFKRSTAQKMKFSIKDLFSKCDQSRRKMRIWSHLLKKSLMENLIFCAACCGSKLYEFKLYVSIPTLDDKHFF